MSVDKYANAKAASTRKVLTSLTQTTLHSQIPVLIPAGQQQQGQIPQQVPQQPITPNHPSSSSCGAV